jgi:hypothetical protein
MDTILCLIAGPLLLVSVAAHVYVRVRLKPRDNSDLDECYYEFEESHPAYARYLFWSRITFAVIATSVLLFFIAIAV